MLTQAHARHVELPSEQVMLLAQTKLHSRQLPGQAASALQCTEA